MSWLDEAAAFFAALDLDNTREHWALHRAPYDGELRPAFVELVEAVPGWGPWRVYRPHNDTRFGGAPYKTFLGAVTERGDGVGAFVQVGPRGLLLGTGVPMPAPDQLARLRAALTDDAAGPGFVAAAEQVASTGARVHGGRYAPLARVPRGFPADSPRAAWLRWKGVEVTQRPALARDPSAEGVGELLTAGEPLHRWLAEHVGPSAMTPEERFAPRAARRG
jgi:uncharacterized protein (DUF2461 family)